MLRILRILRYLKFPRFLIKANDEKGFCFACGQHSQFKKQNVLRPELVKTWQIIPNIEQAFNVRESMFCTKCKNTYRTRKLAEALVKVYGDNKTKSLKDLIKISLFRKLRIAEINSCGNLHQFLKNLPDLYYSEYQRFKKFKGIRFEDLMNLSYKDKFFDLVLTSDTLEHVPDMEKALKEIHRVLKQGGLHIFTIPTILSRKTRDRIVVLRNKKIQKHLPSSYHGSGEKDNIVYREFGGDVIQILEKSGFKAKIYFCNLIKDDYSYVFVCQKS